MKEPIKTGMGLFQPLLNAADWKQWQSMNNVRDFPPKSYPAFGRLDGLGYPHPDYIYESDIADMNAAIDAATVPGEKQP